MAGEETVTGLDLLTLGIAVVGAVTGIAGLAWGVASHVLSGARVKVRLLVGFVADGGVATLPYERFDPAKAPPMSGFGPAEPVVGVEVRNVGRMPCTVQSWSIALDSGVSLGQVDLPINPSLPHRLDSGESATFYADMESVVALIETATEVLGSAKTIRGRVSLGDGREVQGTAHPIN